jgi:6-phosphogluconate dehydrogenase (decarboxylating)
MSTVAFAGLGIMGAPMAKHLVDASHEVLGVNRSKPVAALHAQGHGDLDHSALLRLVEQLSGRTEES